MTAHRLVDFIDHMQQAACDACTFVEGLSKEDFLDDKRTQNAVVMSILVLGEAATKVMDCYPDFAQNHGEIIWRGMRGMRNRLAHGYFDINLEIVWDTVQTSLPDLINKLIVLRSDAEKEIGT